MQIPSVHFWMSSKSIADTDFIPNQGLDLDLQIQMQNVFLGIRYVSIMARMVHKYPTNLILIGS